MKQKKGLHIFRRDLRLEDNAALCGCDTVSPCFIFTPLQVTHNYYIVRHLLVVCKRKAL